MDQNGIEISGLRVAFFRCRIAALLAACAFRIVQTPAPSSSGHKPTQRRGRERHFAGLSYARQSYMGAYAFRYCPGSSSQPLESLQSYRQWQKAPLPVRLPALIGAKRLPTLFVFLL